MDSGKMSRDFFPSMAMTENLGLFRGGHNTRLKT